MCLFLDTCSFVSSGYLFGGSKSQFLDILLFTPANKTFQKALSVHLKQLEHDHRHRDQFIPVDRAPHFASLFLPVIPTAIFGNTACLLFRNKIDQ
jgi:hypothetical protein